MKGYLPESWGFGDWAVHSLITGMVPFWAICRKVGNCGHLGQPLESWGFGACAHLGPFWDPFWPVLGPFCDRGGAGLGPNRGPCVVGILCYWVIVPIFTLWGVQQLCHRPWSWPDRCYLGLFGPSFDPYLGAILPPFGAYFPHLLWSIWTLFWGL